jgi:hypothetical protein
MKSGDDGNQHKPFKGELVRRWLFYLAAQREQAFVNSASHQQNGETGWQPPPQGEARCTLSKLGAGG